MEQNASSSKRQRVPYVTTEESDSEQDEGDWPAAPKHAPRMRSACAHTEPVSGAPWAEALRQVAKRSVLYGAAVQRQAATRVVATDMDEEVLRVEVGEYVRALDVLAAMCAGDERAGVLAPGVTWLELVKLMRALRRQGLNIQLPQHQTRWTRSSLCAEIASALAQHPHASVRLPL